MNVYEFENNVSKVVKKATITKYELRNYRNELLISFTLNKSNVGTWLLIFNMNGKRYRKATFPQFPNIRPNEDKLNREYNFDVLVDSLCGLYLQGKLILEDNKEVKKESDLKLQYVVNQYLKYKSITITTNSLKSYSNMTKHLTNIYTDSTFKYFVSINKPQFITDLNEYALGRKWGNFTYNYFLTVIKDFLKYLNEEKELYKLNTINIENINNIKSVKRRKLDIYSDRFKPIESDVFYKMLSNAKENDKYLYLVMLLMFDTHIRPIELTRLKLKYLNMKEGTLLIHKEINHKSKTSRVIHLSQNTISVLNELIDFKSLNTRDKEKYLFGNSKLISDVEIDEQIMSYHFNSLKKRIGILEDNQTLYSIKHTTNIIKYLSKQFDIHQLKRLNGHCSLEMTERYLRGLDLLDDKKTPIIELNIN